MNGDYDVVEIALPEYREEDSAIPDVENKSSFSEHKEEIYRRNMVIAAEEQTKLLREEEAARAARKAELERIYEESKPVSALYVDKKSAKRISAMLIAAAAAIAAIIINNASLDRRETDADLTAAYEKARSASTICSAELASAIVNDVKISGNQIEGSGTDFIVGDIIIDISEDYDWAGYVYGEFDEKDRLMNYTLWSPKPIPDEYKRQLTDIELKTLAKEGIIIGCYPSEP